MNPHGNLEEKIWDVGLVVVLHHRDLGFMYVLTGTKTRGGLMKFGGGREYNRRTSSEY